MTRDDVLRMARDAGFHFRDAGHGPEVLHTEPLEYSQKCFERFAALVAAAEREKCAKEADKRLHAGDAGPAIIAAAIRARKPA